MPINYINYINIVSSSDKINIPQFIIEKFYQSVPSNEINEKLTADTSQHNICFSYDNTTWETVALKLATTVIRISSDNQTFIDKKMRNVRDKFLLNKDRYIFMGTDTLDIYNYDELRYVTNDMIEKKGINNIADYLQKLTNGIACHLSIDIDTLIKGKVLTKDVLYSLLPNVLSINFTGLNKMSHIECVKDIIKRLAGVTEKKINIFTEHSRFLIYRSVEQMDDSVDQMCDIGWYILRNVSNDLRNSIIEKIGEDGIITMDIGGDGDFYITSTTIDEQNKKSYYTAVSVLDCCLFPAEFKDMAFELLNCQPL